MPPLNLGLPLSYRRMPGQCKLTRATWTWSRTLSQNRTKQRRPNPGRTRQRLLNPSQTR